VCAVLYVCVPNMQYVPNPDQNINPVYCHNPVNLCCCYCGYCFCCGCYCHCRCRSWGGLLVGGGRGCGVGGGVARWECGVGLVGGDVVVGG
jgi:hypothetical protein